MMVGHLFCCLWPLSPTEPPSFEEIQNDLRGPLARRRRLAEKIVVEEEVRAELASTMDNLRKELIRRLNQAKSNPALLEESDEEVCRKCWTGELYPWFGPTPARVSKELLESEFRLAARWESLEVVHQKICRLQDECAEALSREHPEQHVAREEFDADALLLPTVLEMLDPIDDAKATVSVARQLEFSATSASAMATSYHGDTGPAAASAEIHQQQQQQQQQVVDWDAKIDAAHRKLKASNARVRRSLEKFDRKYHHHHHFHLHHYQPASGPQDGRVDALGRKDHSTHSQLAVPASECNLKDISLSCSAKCLAVTVL